jgi:hypothetical protein
MIRKSLFWGLTLVLMVALINLIIRGRRLEKQQSGRFAEDVRESQPTPTRVLVPRDLEIVQAKMRLEAQGSGKDRYQTARHEIEIRNNGKVPYGGIQLSFDYLDRSGKVLATKTQSVAQTILPGTSEKLPDIKVEGLAASTADFQAAILYADIGRAPLPK